MAPAAWARPVWILGACFSVVHTLIAFATRCGWDHEAAVRATAMHCAALCGFA